MYGTSFPLGGGQKDSWRIKGDDEGDGGAGKDESVCRLDLGLMSCMSNEKTRWEAVEQVLTMR